jgi:hypothetical protein
MCNLHGSGQLKSTIRPTLPQEGSPPLKIPNPHARGISVDLLKKILKQANISRSEWLRSG